MARRLPLKQQKFVANYILLCGNGVRAVYAAGYKQGYDSACVTASRLLRNTKVEDELEKHAAKAKLSADQVIEELTVVAQAEVRLEGAQKVKALELLGKFHKLFVDKVETTEIPNDSLASAQQIFAKKYQELNSCSPEEAQKQAEIAFQFAKVEDHTNSQAS